MSGKETETVIKKKTEMESIPSSTGSTNLERCEGDKVTLPKVQGDKDEGFTLVKSKMGIRGGRSRLEHNKDRSNSRKVGSTPAFQPAFRDRFKQRRDPQVSTTPAQNRLGTSTKRSRMEYSFTPPSAKGPAKKPRQGKAKEEQVMTHKPLFKVLFRKANKDFFTNDEALELRSLICNSALELIEEEDEDQGVDFINSGLVEGGSMFIISCGDELTVKFVRDTLKKLWDERKYVVCDINDLPKKAKVSTYAVGLETRKESINKLLRISNRKAGLNIKDWELVEYNREPHTGHGTYLCWEVPEADAKKLQQNPMMTLELNRIRVEVSIPPYPFYQR
ncbi:uncharacterized protein LOC106667182 [Cimex lectularius]|uniref:DUF4780 domain-containing protein n=1 Tax=Cimex lectularius TaxID=79782 RepID=A0A8I6RUR7_CIMLE|nr:uncharacterized protein LOC106667182 [Cimex lectularius]XP_014250431.1 uncharacterized protein LOC106667182 [Cimex lectularius]XP_014250433.1 uncharacterized protein LOC106667182 [Cimex lectularius]